MEIGGTSDSGNKDPELEDGDAKRGQACERRTRDARRLANTDCSPLTSVQPDQQGEGIQI
jgi:hypothetical protein